MMGWIHSKIESAIRKRIKLDERDWLLAKIDREYAINRIHADLMPLGSYVGKIRKDKSNALQIILETITSYDQLDSELIKSIRIESTKLLDL